MMIFNKEKTTDIQLEQPDNQLTPIRSIDAKTLSECEYKPIEFLIHGLLPQGLHILAGSPKIGKSWLVLYLCNQIASGEPVWDYSTKQGKVLYICLEDTYRRIFHPY